MNYLTADSIDDDERIMLYFDETFICYEAMVAKLEEAIKRNPELKNNEAVKEYLKLTTGEE